MPWRDSTAATKKVALHQRRESIPTLRLPQEQPGWGPFLFPRFLGIVSAAISLTVIMASESHRGKNQGGCDQSADLANLLKSGIHHPGRDRRTLWKLKASIWNQVAAVYSFCGTLNLFAGIWCRRQSDSGTLSSSSLHTRSHNSSIRKNNRIEFLTGFSSLECYQPMSDGLRLELALHELQ
jgi:hypothetical protein